MRLLAVCSQDISTIFGGESAEGSQDLLTLGSEWIMHWASSKGRIQASVLPMKYLYLVQYCKIVIVLWFKTQK